MRGRINTLLAALCIALAITVAVQAISPFRGAPHDQAADAAAKGGQNQQSHLAAFWKWTTHDPVAFYTSLLAVFTGVLAVSTIGLWLVTYFTLRHARTDAARQARETAHTIRLAQDEFRSSYPPRLRLKHIWLATDDGQRFFGRIEAGRQIRVRLDIVNVGGHPAILTVLNLVTVLLPRGQRLPQRPPYNDEGVPQTQLGAFRLASGITFTQSFSDGRVLTDEEVREIRRGSVILYFVGTIEYWHDDASTLRQTAFCRYLSFAERPAAPDDNGRLQKDDDPDYEYQD